MKIKFTTIRFVFAPFFMAVWMICFNSCYGQSSIARIIEPSTICMLRIDLERLDLPSVRKALQEQLPELIPDQASNGVMALVGGAIASLKTAGARELYFTLSSIEFLSGKAAVIVPTLDPEKLAEQVQALVGILPPAYGYSVHKTTDMVIACTEPVWQRLRPAATAEHPAHARDVVVKPSSHVALTVSIRDDLRASVAKLLPAQLPKDFPVQLQPQQLMRDIRSLRWDFTSGKQMTMELTFECTDADVAKNVQSQWMSLAEQFNIELPPPQLLDGKVLTSLNPVEMKRLTQRFTTQFAGQAGWSQQSNNLKQIGLGFHQFYQQYDGFPPRMTVTRGGTPLLSWRVHLLPFIGAQQLYDKFHLDEPWSSTHNQQLVSQMPRAYQNLVGPPLAAGLTCVQVPLLEGSFWNGTENRWMTFLDVHDGTSNTICYVIAPNDKAVVWTQPEDLQLKPNDVRASLFGDREKMQIAFFDTSVHSVPADVSDETIRAWLTASGGESGVPNP